MKSILIIEDNTDIRENLEEILLMEGYGVLTAANGKTGIEQALQAKPDFILCDIAMPEKTGYEVFDTLQPYLCSHRVPFVFLTASAQERDIAKGVAKGVNAYLTKPFYTEELLTTIRNIMAQNRVVS